MSSQNKRLEALLDAVSDYMRSEQLNEQELEDALHKYKGLQNIYKKKKGHYYTPKYKYIKRINY